MMSSEPNLITVYPNPPVRGQELQICYDFGKIENPPSQIALALHWEPDTIQVPSSIIVNTGSSCAIITVPSGATGLVIEDETGNSADWAGTVGSS